jgi:plasmid stability protein
METKRMISLEISDSLREALRVEAFNRNKTISATIRDILENYLKETDNDTDK